MCNSYKYQKYLNKIALVDSEISRLIFRLGAKLWTTDSLIEFAETKYENNYIETSREILFHILEKYPTNIRVLSLLARVHSTAGAFDNALRMVSSAILISNNSKSTEILRVQKWSGTR